MKYTVKVQTLNHIPKSESWTRGGTGATAVPMINTLNGTRIIDIHSNTVLTAAQLKTSVHNSIGLTATPVSSTIKINNVIVLDSATVDNTKPVTYAVSYTPVTHKYSKHTLPTPVGSTHS